VRKDIRFSLARTLTRLACGRASITALRGSVPPQWISLFRGTQGRHARVHFSQRAQLSQLFAELRAGGGSNASAASVRNARGGARGTPAGATAAADAVTLGDAWLAPAIAAGLIAPIPKADASRWLARLPAAWAPLLRRRACDGAVSESGSIYGVPYRWGCVLLALRTDAPAAAGVADWGDLLRPALRGRVAAVDAPRELLAAALRSLGASANTASLAALPRGVTPQALQDRLRDLHRQASASAFAVSSFSVC
jgi:spermidine/putrescine-binding protein